MDKIKYVIITGILAVLLGTLIIEPGAESIEIGHYTGNVGDIVEVNVTVNGTDISGLGFELIFDNSKLYALNVAEGDFMKNACNTTFNTIPPEINNTSGTIKFYNFCWGQTVNGSGVIAAILFNITGSGTSSLILQNVTVFDEEGNLTNESITAHNGSVDVHECDLNNDGIIIHDYNDLMNAYKCFLGIENCNNYYQNWNLMKQEYECFVGNFN